jgi:hypothetical protein
MHYKFWMKNGKVGDYWYEQFSADEFCKFEFLKAVIY